MSDRQLAAFADTHAWRVPFDTSPRHLAGPGDGRHVTHGLAAAGWTLTSDPLSPEIVLTSRDHRHRLQFDPQSATSAWWRLRTEPGDAEPGWYAEFGELAPAEVLSSFIDALVAPSPAQQPDVFDALETAGWTIGAENAAVSPDGMCHIGQRHDSDWHDAWTWTIDTCEPGHGTPKGPRIWHARLQGNTPTHLVAAFTTALTNPAPLQRGMFDPTAHYSAVQEPSLLSPQQVVDAHVQRVRALRTQTRAARRRTRPEPAKAPSSSASRPASPRR